MSRSQRSRGSGAGGAMCGGGYASPHTAWAGYKSSPTPTSPVGVHPLSNYPFIPAHHPMYGAAGAMDATHHVPLVFPYGVPHPQGHPMYAAAAHMPGMNGKSLGYGQHYLVPMAIPVPNREEDAYSPDFLEEELNGLCLNPMADEYLPVPFEQQDGCAPVAGKRTRTRNRRSRRAKDKQASLQDNVKKTVYISDLDQQITEEQLANFFSDCGVVVDCRVCGDPNSAMRFAFVEFQSVEAAVEALNLTGCDLGSSRVRVLPSKTAIVPVNKELMPRNKDEMEQCSRTVYATNIDKKVDRDDVQRFFEALCGPVARLRLLGDHAHSTRIAFVEFVSADNALAALSCSGALLGTMPIRVSPSKTPVRFSSKESKAARE